MFVHHRQRLSQLARIVLSQTRRSRSRAQASRTRLFSRTQAKQWTHRLSSQGAAATVDHDTHRHLPGNAWLSRNGHLSHAMLVTSSCELVEFQRSTLAFLLSVSFVFLVLQFLFYSVVYSISHSSSSSSSFFSPVLLVSSSAKIMQLSQLSARKSTSVFPSIVCSHSIERASPCNRKAKKSKLRIIQINIENMLT